MQKSNIFSKETIKYSWGAGGEKDIWGWDGEKGGEQKGKGHSVKGCREFQKCLIRFLAVEFAFAPSQEAQLFYNRAFAS